MDFKNKRFTTWTDETLWSKTAIENGLKYGVYDKKKGKQHYIKGVTITSLEQARQCAIKLNNELKKKKALNPIVK